MQTNFLKEHMVNSGGLKISTNVELRLPKKGVKKTVVFDTPEKQPFYSVDFLGCLFDA